VIRRLEELTVAKNAKKGVNVMMNGSYGNGSGGGWLVMGVALVVMALAVTGLVLYLQRRRSGPK
jgi:uncharacterized iron-regulated membrane protein